MNRKDTRALRLYALAGLLTLVLLMFAGVLYNTQIVNHDYYVAQSIRTIAREEKVEASRGVITDRNGQVIVSCFDLVTGPDKVNTKHDKPFTLAKLSLE